MRDGGAYKGTDAEERACLLSSEKRGKISVKSERYE